MKKLNHLVLALFIFALIKAAYGSVYSDPTRPPGFPRELPPAAAHAQAAQKNASQGGDTFTASYDLVKGWNVISFPFSKVLATRGFTRKLLHYEGGSYYTIDPNSEISRINPRWGYLVYADNPGKASALGVHNNRHIRSVSLGCGWNLIACPSSKSAPWSRLLAVIGSSSQPALDVAGLPSSGENYWISSRAYRFDRGLESIDLKAPEAVIPSKQGLWVFVWHPLTLTVAPGAEQVGTLRIERVVPSSVAPGQTATIDGNGFCTSPSAIFLAGVPINADYILSWSATRIVFRVPTYVMSGSLVVVVNGTPSNKVDLTVSEGGGPAAGATLTGKVQDGNKRPLAGVLIMLQNGMSSYSKADGTFLIEHLPAGEYGIEGSLTGHRSAHGTIALGEGGSKNLLITLSSYDEVLPASLPASPAEPLKKKDEQIASEKGTLYAVASAYYYSNKRWWVYRIDVTEWGNGSYYWHNTWYNDYGDVNYELKCPGARIGKIYNFKVEWRTRDGSKIYTNTWQRKMYKESQKENFDTPY
jgi:hypothetical protein